MNDQIEIMEAAIKGQQEKMSKARDIYLKESDELKAMKDNLAALCCPHSVGDTVEILGYSHKGKKMVIKKIRRAEYDFMGRWMVCGAVLKKNGVEGMQQAEFCEQHTEDFAKAF